MVWVVAMAGVGTAVAVGVAMVGGVTVGVQVVVQEGAEMAAAAVVEVEMAVVRSTREDARYQIQFRPKSRERYHQVWAARSRELGAVHVARSSELWSWTGTLPCQSSGLQWPIS